MLSRLLELLYVDVFSSHMKILAGEQMRLLAGLRDALVDRALEVLHGRPEDAWSLKDLARIFRQLRTVGEMPACLCAWRSVFRER